MPDNENHRIKRKHRYQYKAFFWSLISINATGSKSEIADRHHNANLDSEI